MRQKVIGSALILLTLLLPASASADSIFWLDTPQPGQTVAGLVEVSGWILDDGQDCGPPSTWQACDWTDAMVSNIDLYVNGDYVASADLNQPRFDVLQAYPWYVGTPYRRPGFSTSFDSSSLDDGIHSLFVRVSYTDMTTEDLGFRTVNVDNTINQVPFGELEMPGPSQPMNGVFPITGWSLDGDGYIEDVEIMVDGLVVGHAVTGVHRPDIAHRFPSNPDAEDAGFVRMINTGTMANGIHILAVRLRDNDGATRIIGRRFVQVLNTGYNLAPFGGIDWPVANHVMFGRGCDEQGGGIPSGPQYEQPRSIEHITGWALDIGSAADRGGVKWVELLLNGTILANTLVDDFYYWDFESDVNYYGHERMDIFELFPDVPQAKHSGFTFLVDVGYLVATMGYHQGLHYLKVRAGDIEGNVADIATLPVILDCDDDPDRPAFGDIYTPVHMGRVSGTVDVTGWAIDYEYVWAVEIWVDGVFIGLADFLLPSPEVVLKYPWYLPSFAEDAGYSYDLDTTQLTDGEHRVVVRTEDRWGFNSIIGERVFVVDNLN
ncbi:MAG: hypothetical protein GY906_04410 [bacterium]|nr:hypothetical protein [bacterium]